MKRIIITAILICSFIMVSGCNHHQTSEVNDPKPTKKKSEAPAGLTKPTNPNNILVNIKEGMTPTEVRNLIGNPKRQNIYPTGKQFIPYYHGTDRTRMDWFYGDYGHITFTINYYSGHKQVLKVHFK